MSKLDDWLAAPQNKEEHPGAGTHVRVATSRLDFVPVVSAALKELSSQHPDLHCTLVLGEEQELTGALPAALSILPLYLTILPCHLYSTATSHCSLSLLIF